MRQQADGGAQIDDDAARVSHCQCSADECPHPLHAVACHHAQQGDGKNLANPARLHVETTSLHGFRLFVHAAVCAFGSSLDELWRPFPAPQTVPLAFHDLIGLLGYENTVNEPTAAVTSYTSGQKLVAVAVGMLALGAVVMVAVPITIASGAPQALAVEFGVRALIPLPFIFWIWPGLVWRPLRAIGRLLK